MATYQFKLGLIPKEWAEKNDYNPELLLDDTGMYDLTKAWNQCAKITYHGQLFSPILPKSTSWHPKLNIWGNEEQTDLQVWVDEKTNIESILVRLDMREDITQLIGQVVHLAENLNCVLFLYEYKKIILPDITNLKEFATNSNAWKFVQNPKEFLIKIHNQEKSKY